VCLAIVAEDGRHEFGALRMVKILAEEKLSWCSLDSTCGGDWMRVRVSFLVVMLAIGCVGMLGQSNATTSGGGQVPDAANSPAPGSKDHPVIVSPGVLAGLLQHKVDPVYPDDARKAKISGPVVM
jgi:hypothetical protein